mmetsp:Transcript_5109/g.15046  ORF Transcript_5109/g.15046 Transcript_5109/m.15046 type:complete len:213 (-) Transcript_5109:426-1064(-)
MPTPHCPRSRHSSGLASAKPRCLRRRIPAALRGCGRLDTATAPSRRCRAAAPRTQSSSRVQGRQAAARGDRSQTWLSSLGGSSPRWLPPLASGCSWPSAPAPLPLGTKPPRAGRLEESRASPAPSSSRVPGVRRLRRPPRPLACGSESGCEPQAWRRAWRRAARSRRPTPRGCRQSRRQAGRAVRKLRRSLPRPPSPDSHRGRKSGGAGRGR